MIASLSRDERMSVVSASVGFSASRITSGILSTTDAVVMASSMLAIEYGFTRNPFAPEASI
jgi:hypothetical protein